MASQTQHIAPRIVNDVTFLEVLFSSTGVEITHQLASCVSWYLMRNNSHDRLALYNQVKKIYKIRSVIVHGRNVPEGGYNTYKENVVEIEEINKKVINHILDNDHLGNFKFGEKKRKNELEKLSLGIECSFFN